MSIAGIPIAMPTTDTGAVSAFNISGDKPRAYSLRADAERLLSDGHRSARRALACAWIALCRSEFRAARDGSEIESARQLGLANTGRSEKNKRAERTIRVLQTGAGAADGV